MKKEINPKGPNDLEFQIIDKNKLWENEYDKLLEENNNIKIITNKGNIL